MKRKFALLFSLLLITVSVVPATSAVLAANAAPTVLPAIRNWTGGSGNFVPDSSTVLVYNGSEATEQIKLVQGFFADMLGLDVEIASSAPSSNAIIFKIGANQTDNPEGYTLVASSAKIEITATTNIGLLYGGISVVQSVYAEGYFPAGTAVDYPAYPVRQGMIDVGRQWTPLDSLMDITRYMAWYKLNEIQVHINDCLDENPYSAFRLESDVPGLTATDGYYTKEEYRQYQRDAQKYGVTVLTEIDTPFHSACFANVDLGDESPRMLDETDGVASYYIGKCLDIRDETTVKFVENLFYEYLGGDDPVILNDTIHIGLDEFPAQFKEDMYVYTERIIRYVNDLGYKARFWSGLGEEGCMYGMDMPDDLNVEIDYWALHLSGSPETVNTGYGVINKMNEYFYIVPGEKDGPLLGFEDYFGYESLEFLYNRVQVNTANIYLADPELMDADDPNMLGASFSIWNDYASAYIGITFRDVIDRIREAACLIAEKTWNGTDTGSKISFSDFYSRFTKLSERGGDVDLFERDLPEGGINIDFRNGVPEYVSLSGNVSNGKFVLDGESYIAFDEKYEYYGFPNTLSFNITLDELPSERTNLFDSANGDCAVFIDADGTIGYEKINTAAENYVYTFGYKLEVGKETNVVLSSDRLSMILVIDGAAAYNAINADQAKVPDAQKHKHYSAFMIPLAKIGEGIVGKINNITVASSVYDASSMELNSSNLALNATVSVSGIEASHLGAENAVDGDTSTRLSFAIDTDYQWLVIDLGKVIPVNAVEIDFKELSPSYEIWLSEDGINYNRICSESGLTGGSASVETVTLDESVNARYVKYVQLARWYHSSWNTYYSSTINEVRVYSSDLSKYNSLVSYANAYAETLDASSAERETVTELANTLENLLSYDSVFLASVESAYDELYSYLGGTLPNVLLGLTPEISGTGVGAGDYNADLTDGIASLDAFPGNSSEWFLFNNSQGSNTVDRVGTVIFDLGAIYDLKMARVHLWNNTGWGVGIPTAVTVEVSPDGENFTPVEKSFEISEVDSIAYWSTVGLTDVCGRYLKFSFDASGHYYTFTGVNEIEAYGTVHEQHNAGEWVTTKEPTETEEGEKTQYCTGCGEVLATETIPVVEVPDPAFVRGDVDGNGEVKTADYIILKRVLLGVKQMDTLKDPETAYDRCDVNANGEVKTGDYLLLKRALLGSYIIPE